MSKIIFIFCGLLLALTVSSPLKAQTGWNWGEESLRAKEYWNLLRLALQDSNFTEAQKPLSWLLRHTPQLHPSLYQKGILFYANALEKAEASQKAAYQDTIMTLLSQKLHFFDNRGAVLSEATHYASFYWADKPEKLDSLWTMLAELFDQYPKEVRAAHCQSYFGLAQKRLSQNILSKAQFLALYQQLHQQIEQQIEADVGQSASWQAAQAALDALLRQSVPLDCKFIEQYYFPALEAQPDSLPLLEAVMALMIEAKCLDHPRFVQMAGQLAQAAPTFGRLQFLYRWYLGQGQYELARQYLQKSEALAPSTLEKARSYFRMAQLYLKMGQKAQARQYAEKSAQTAPSSSQSAWNFIGDLYLMSGGDFAQENPVLARAIYLLAYQAYEKAQNLARMQQARAQWPRREAVFQYGLAGQEVKLGGWVQSIVKIPELELLP
ncbi:MAG: tetratricopeptide repeat protein [Microscillaceae bacterium]|nr:tetratricopeptide repeat protein [Microscillaceae bacterium]